MRWAVGVAEEVSVRSSELSFSSEARPRVGGELPRDVAGLGPPVHPWLPGLGVGVGVEGGLGQLPTWQQRLPPPPPTPCQGHPGICRA